MSRRRGAVSVLCMATLVACDALLVGPELPDADPALRLSIAAPLTTSLVDFANVLERVEQVRFTIIRAGVQRDTVVAARYANAELVTRIRLEWQEANGWIDIVADLELGTGEPLFTGQAGLQAGVVGPQVRIDLVPVVASLSSTTLPLIESLGGQTPLEAVARFATGDEIVGAEIEWTSYTPEVFEIAPGLVGVARANGEAEIAASIQGLEARQRVVVRQIPWGLTGIVPADTTISVGDSFQLRPLGTDARGSPLQPGAAVWWFLPYVGVAELDEVEGIVTAIAPGQAQVEGSYLDTSDYLSVITVVP